MEQLIVFPDFVNFLLGKNTDYTIVYAKGLRNPRSHKIQRFRSSVSSEVIEGF